MDSRQAQELVKVIKSLLPIVGDKYLFRSAIEFLEDFDQLGPYRPGDRVELVVNPECKGGWADSKHFLVKGARATVSDLHWFVSDPRARCSGWVLGLVFDDESWIPSYDYPEKGQMKGVPVPTPADQRHSFWLAAADVRPLTSKDVLEQDRDYIDVGLF